LAQASGLVLVTGSAKAWVKASVAAWALASGLESAWELVWASGLVLEMARDAGEMD
jgi:hypothetical protein